MRVRPFCFVFLGVFALLICQGCDVGNIRVVGDDKTIGAVIYVDGDRAGRIHKRWFRRDRWPGETRVSMRKGISEFMIISTAGETLRFDSGSSQDLIEVQFEGMPHGIRNRNRIP